MPIPPERTIVPEPEKKVAEPPAVNRNDWNWVRGQDDIDEYKHFLAQHPNHSEKKWIEKRIIDLEVQKIAGAEHGKMPAMQPVRLGGSAAEIEITNNTGYILTVRYSGPDSRKVVIPKEGKRTLSLMPGKYQVAASVDSATVTNYYGEATLQAAKYNESFYTMFSGFNRKP